MRAVRTRKGIHLLDTSVGAGGVLTGSARLAEELNQATARRSQTAEVEARRAAFDHRRHLLEAQLLALQAERDSEALQIEVLSRQEAIEERRLATHNEQLAKSRWAFKNVEPRSRR